MKWILVLILAMTVSCSSNKLKHKTVAEKQANLHYTHGTSDLIEKQYTSALDHLIKANELTPGDTKILNNLGMAYFFKKDMRYSLKYLNASIAADPKNSDARNNLASLYYNLGKYKQAEKEYLIIQTDLVYSAQYRVLYNLALIQFKRGNSLKANNYLTKAIAENMSYCPSYFLQGRIHETSRNYEEAYKSYRSAYQGVCLKNPAPHFKAAEVLLKMRKYEQARAKYSYIIENFATSEFSALATEKILKIRQTIRSTNNSEAYTHQMKMIEDEVKDFQAPSF